MLSRSFLKRLHGFCLWFFSMVFGFGSAFTQCQFFSDLNVFFFWCGGGVDFQIILPKKTKPPKAKLFLLNWTQLQLAPFQPCEVFF